MWVARLYNIDDCGRSNADAVADKRSAGVQKGPPGPRGLSRCEYGLCAGVTQGKSERRSVGFCAHHGFI